jgi:hypothetical protein
MKRRLSPQSSGDCDDDDAFRSKRAKFSDGKLTQPNVFQSNCKIVRAASQGKLAALMDGQHTVAEPVLWDCIDPFADVTLASGSVRCLFDLLLVVPARRPERQSGLDPRPEIVFQVVVRALSLDPVKTNRSIELTLGSDHSTSSMDYPSASAVMRAGANYETFGNSGNKTLALAALEHSSKLRTTLTEGPGTGDWMNVRNFLLHPSVDVARATVGVICAEKWTQENKKRLCVEVFSRRNFQEDKQRDHVWLDCYGKLMERVIPECGPLVETLFVKEMTKRAHNEYKIRLMLGTGVDVNCTDNKGVSPLIGCLDNPSHHRTLCYILQHSHGRGLDWEMLNRAVELKGPKFLSLKLSLKGGGGGGGGGGNETEKSALAELCTVLNLCERSGVFESFVEGLLSELRSILPDALADMVFQYSNHMSKRGDRDNQKNKGDSKTGTTTATTSSPGPCTMESTSVSETTVDHDTFPF